MLTLMDGMKDRGKVVVIAATGTELYSKISQLYEDQI